MSFILQHWCLASILWCIVVADTYRSIFQLEQLFRKEIQLTGDSEIQPVCNSSALTWPAWQLARHPVAAYHFIKCHYQRRESGKGFYSATTLGVGHNEKKILLSLIHLMYADLKNADLKGVALSLVRLRDIYQLDVKDLLAGTVLHFPSESTLTGKQ